VRARGQGGRERGASLVEFAFVVPLLTLFLFGIVQFGIAYDKQQSVNSASREGARLGALRTTTMADIGLYALKRGGR
jgi:Flp pilus assembly protein TadG